IIGVLHHDLPEIFTAKAKNSSTFKCSDSWVQTFLYDHLQYTMHKGIQAAQKLPMNIDEVCLEQFL
ncbi:hypothetical protein BDR05DRAFT_894129, partial [Suillus weaverae]